MSSDRVGAFWELAKRHAKLTRMPGWFGPSALESLPPPAWSFGSTPEEADAGLGELFDDGRITTRVPLADYRAAEEPLPEEGTLGIVLDGDGEPRALVVTKSVEVDRSVAGADAVVECIQVLFRAPGTTRRTTQDAPEA